MKKLIIFILLLLPAMVMAFDMRSQGLTQSKIEATTFNTLTATTGNFANIGQSTGTLDSTKLNLSGGTMTGQIRMGAYSILGSSSIYINEIFTTNNTRVGGELNISGGGLTALRIGGQGALGINGSKLRINGTGIYFTPNDSATELMRLKSNGTLEISTITAITGGTIVSITTNTRIDGIFYPKAGISFPDGTVQVSSPSAPSSDKVGNTIYIAAAGASANSKTRADYVCNGDNDVSNFMSAFSDLYTTGGALELSEGTFTFITKLELSISSITIRGNNGTIISPSPTGTFTAYKGLLHGVTTYNVTIENIIFDGRAKSGSINAIDLGDGPISTAYAKKIKILNCQFNEWSGDAAVDMAYNSDCIVLGNIIKQTNLNFGSGIRFSYSSYSVISNNIVEGNTGNSCFGISFSNSGNCTIANNFVYKCDIGLYLGNDYNCEIIGNVSTNNDRYGIYGGVPLRNCQFTNNVASNNGIDGIAIVTSATQNCMENQVVSNMINLNGGYGINIGANANIVNMFVSGNCGWNNTSGALFTANTDETIQWGNGWNEILTISSVTVNSLLTVNGAIVPQAVDSLPASGYGIGSILQLTTDDYMTYTATETVVGVWSWRKQ